MAALTHKGVLGPNFILGEPEARHTYTCNGGTLYFHGQGVRVKVWLVHAADWKQPIDVLTNTVDFIDVFGAGDDIEVQVKADGSGRGPRFVLREV